MTQERSQITITDKKPQSKFKVGQYIYYLAPVQHYQPVKRKIDQIIYPLHPAGNPILLVHDYKVELREEDAYATKEEFKSAMCKRIDELN